MTTKPSAAAERLALDLERVLDAIRAHFVGRSEPSISAVFDRRDFEPARQISADVEHIANATDRIKATLQADETYRIAAMRCEEYLDDGRRPGRFNDAIGNAIFELAGTSPVTACLEMFDPERHANDDQLAARLRESGNWSDDVEADCQLDMAERAARLPEVPQ
jgi:hypothetical protein